MGFTSRTTKWHNVRFGVLCGHFVRSGISSCRCRRNTARDRRNGFGGNRYVIFNFVTKEYFYFYTVERKRFFILGAPIGSSVGGYLFSRFGSSTSFKYLSCFALAVCITQSIVNQLINHFSKNEKDEEEVST